MKFRSFLIISFTFLFLSPAFLQFASAQDNRNWILRFQITPGVSYHQLLNKDGSTQTEGIIGVWNDVDHPVLTWQANFSLARTIGKFQIVTGPGFSQVGFKQVIDTLNYGYFPPPFDPYLTHYKTSIFYQGIECPVQLHYETKTEKWKWFIEGGGGLSWFFNQHSKSFSYYSDDSQKEDESNGSDRYEFDHVHPFVKLSTGISYHPCERWKIDLSPTASYYFITPDKNAISNGDLAIAPHFYFVGLNAGISFSF